MSSFIFDFSFIFPPFHPIRLSIQPLHSSYAKPHPPPFHCRQPIGSSAASWNVCRHASVCMRAGKKLLLWRFIGSWNSVDVPLVGRGVRCIPPPASSALSVSDGVTLSQTATATESQIQANARFFICAWQDYSSVI